MKTGVELIAEERNRQVDKEGWSSEHDDEHTICEIARAASCYAMPPGLAFREYMVHTVWPFDLDSFKPTPNDRVRELVKAGALIAAEIDRLNRAEEARVKELGK